MRSRAICFVLTDETRAVEVARMKDEFVGMISHELRTPLSAIIGFLDLLQNDPAQPLTDDQQEFVGIIERNAQRLLNLVGDLLFTAQVESGRFPLEREEADVAALVRSAVASAGPHAQREGVELVAEVEPGAVPVFIDAGRVGQAIDNLLSNAIKFTPRGGTVTARVRAVDGGVEFSIADTGVGIPKTNRGCSSPASSAHRPRRAMRCRGWGSVSQSPARSSWRTAGRWRSRARRAWERSSASPCRRLPAPRC